MVSLGRDYFICSILKGVLRTEMKYRFAVSPFDDVPMPARCNASLLVTSIHRSNFCLSLRLFILFFGKTKSGLYLVNRVIFYATQTPINRLPCPIAVS